MVDISTLPNSVDELKEVIKGLNSQMLAQHQKIQLLEDKVTLLQRSHYASKSEKVPSNQLGLFN